MSSGEVERDTAVPAWVPWAGLGLVLAVQVFLLSRAFMPAPHTGGDNAGYLSLAFSLLDRGAYLDLYVPGEPLHTKYPPGYPLVLALAMVAGARTWAAFKFISAGFMVLAVAVAYRWVWARAGWRVALGVALVLAVSDSFVYSSLWILSDPMFLALTLVALLAFDHALRDGGRADSTDSEPLPDEAGDDAEDGAAGISKRWWTLGVLAALLAYFTRSAGLPLVAAALGLLALRKQWKLLGISAVAVAVPAFLWWLRSRAVGPGAYASEFWFINPYQPDLGRVGLLELSRRVGENVHLYLGQAVPSGITGVRGVLAIVIGYGIGVLAAAGWAKRLTKRPGVAELFFPLYCALILVWPQVWSGDRFALPLFPLVLFYAWHSVADTVRRAHPMLPGVVGVLAVLACVIPASQAWSVYARQGTDCQVLARQYGVFGCYQQPLRDFARAAAWSSERLPEDAVVVARKPRIFYALSGVQAVSLPLREDADVLLAEARAGGAGYALADYVDSLSELYLLAAVERRSGAFCPIADFGDPSDPRATRLFGLLPEALQRESEVTREGNTFSVLMPRCPADMVLTTPRTGLPQSSERVPLLARLDS